MKKKQSKKKQEFVDMVNRKNITAGLMVKIKKKPTKSILR